MPEPRSAAPRAGGSGGSAPPSGGGKRPSGAKRPRPAPLTADPIVRRLIFAIFAVVIVWLVALLSAIVYGVVLPSSVPRTSAERDLAALTAKVDTGKAKTQVYAQYIDALIRAGQLSKAQSALDQSLKVTKTDRSYLLAEQAQLYMETKDYTSAIATADKAMAEAQKELKAFIAANVAANRKPEAGAVMPTSYTTAALDKATALYETKDYAAEIKALDAYLTQQPADSDILVMRAQAKVKAGDKTGAEADYRTALKYIPDYQPALDGLKQIGASR